MSLSVLPSHPSVRWELRVGFQVHGWLSWSHFPRKLWKTS